MGADRPHRAREAGIGSTAGRTVGGATVAAAVVLAIMVLAPAAASRPAHHRAVVARSPRHDGPVAAESFGPNSQYDCAFNLSIDAFVGADGTASAIGWEGNHQGVVTCLGGTFLVQDGLGRDFGFGLYRGGRTSWEDADGYLPAQITTFRRGAALVRITEFVDRLVLGGDAYVAVYVRVAVENSTGHVIRADPAPSPGLVPLAAGPDLVAPHSESVHDYVVAGTASGASTRGPAPGHWRRRAASISTTSICRPTGPTS